MKKKILSILVIFAMLFPFGIVANVVRAEDAITEVVVNGGTEANEAKNITEAMGKLGENGGTIKLEKNDEVDGEPIAIIKK